MTELTATLQSWLRPWTVDLDERDRAWALLGLGMFDPGSQSDPGALLSLQQRLKTAPQDVHLWRLDRAIADRQWRDFPPAAEVAGMLKDAFRFSTLRVGLCTGASLPVEDVRELVRRQLNHHQVALHVVGRRASRQAAQRLQSIGCLPGADAVLLAALSEGGARYGNMPEVRVLSPLLAECDVLVVAAHDALAAIGQMESARREIGAIGTHYVVLCTHGPVVPAPTPAQLDALQEMSEAVSAIWLPGEMSIGATIRNICEKLAYRNPLDVAVALATDGAGLLLSHPALLQAPVREAPALAPAPRMRVFPVPSPAPAAPLEWQGVAEAAGAEPDAVAESVEALTPPSAQPRYLQAGFTLPLDSRTPVPGGLQVATEYHVQVFIDAPQAGFSRAGTEFPDLPPLENGGDHELEVIFWEPQLCPEPVVKKISLPPSGPSGRCSFQLTTRPDTRGIHARISVLHRNRVLQTGVLSAAVGSEGAVDFHLDAIPRRLLTELDARQEFSWSLVLNDSEGQGIAHSVLDGQPTALNVDDQDIAGLVRVLGAAMADIVLRPAHYEGLRAPGSESLLRTLAQKGATLREYLSRHAIASGALRVPSHVQVVATRPGKIFPLEFIYEHQAPRMEAKLCEHAEQALAAGECPGSCPSHSAAADAMAITICPMGFWGLRCAIERRAHTPAHNNLRGDYSLLMEPRGTTRVLRPLASTVVGATGKANLVVPTSVSDMMQRIGKVVPDAQLVGSWQEWITAIEARQPATLTLVVHQEADNLGTPLLDIGSKPLLSSDLVEKRHVRGSEAATAPLVLLIGCETGRADISYESFALHFHWHGAALVVSTMAEVLGRQAAPVAADILEAINGVTEPTSFAVVMRDLRRRLLARGTPMVLALVAQGDADWQVSR